MVKSLNNCTGTITLIIVIKEHIEKMKQTGRDKQRQVLVSNIQHHSGNW